MLRLVVILTLVVVGCTEEPNRPQKPTAGYLDQVSSALEQYKQGHHEEAVRQIEAVVARRPGYAEGMMMLGFLHEKQGEAKKAQQWYERAVEVYARRLQEPDRWGLPQELDYALALFMAGQQDRALEIVEQVERTDTGSFAIAEVEELIREGDREKVVSAFAP